MDISNTYCENLFQYQKFETREVKVGNIVMGGNNPIIIQSMTTTDTMDTEATVAESIR
ncbi:MAG: (E)-4-hydroxy-3-methylbut-2-enyl-diphosphate synthase, partial [Flavobacteriales bacterium]